MQKIKIFYNNSLSQIVVLQETPFGKSLNFNWAQYNSTNESINSNDRHMSMNTPLLQSPIGKYLDYDGSEYRTIDKGNKQLIIICTNYINITKTFSDIKQLNMSHPPTDCISDISQKPSATRSLDYVRTETQENNNGQNIKYNYTYKYPKY